MAAGGVGLPRAASGVHCPIRRRRPSGKFELCETTCSTRILTFVAAPNCGSTASSCSRTRETVPRGRLSLADQERVVALLESVQPNGLVRETPAYGSMVKRH